VLDTTEPRTIAAVESAIDVDSTLFIVSSKSGGTIEPNSLFKHFWAAKPDGRHFIAITDPDTKLGALASEHGFRRTFTNDPEIGGATRRCRTSARTGGARRDRRRGPAARLRGRRAELRRDDRAGQLGLWLASRSASWPSSGATS